jgi:hypothetical protein
MIETALVAPMVIVYVRLRVLLSALALSKEEVELGIGIGISGCDVVISLSESGTMDVGTTIGNDVGSGCGTLIGDIIGKGVGSGCGKLVVTGNGVVGGR